MDDWKKLARDILASGLTQKALGDLIGRSQAQVSDLVNGKTKTVEYCVGERLKSLHKKRCKVREGAAA
ncbi:hypothetical protein LMG19089_02907 [Ralstonia edaphis]|nr:hypothetical protein LMG19089_02907 [Ralstonia sp. LMG 6871]